MEPSIEGNAKGQAIGHALLCCRPGQTNVFLVRVQEVDANNI
jgi:hypothetical protein